MLITWNADAQADTPLRKTIWSKASRLSAATIALCASESYTTSSMMINKPLR